MRNYFDVGHSVFYTIRFLLIYFNKINKKDIIIFQYIIRKSIVCDNLPNGNCVNGVFLRIIK